MAFRVTLSHQLSHCGEIRGLVGGEQGSPQSGQRLSCLVSRRSV